MNHTRRTRRQGRRDLAGGCGGGGARNGSGTLERAFRPRESSLAAAAESCVFVSAKPVAEREAEAKARARGEGGQAPGQSEVDPALR